MNKELQLLIKNKIEYEKMSCERYSHVYKKVYNDYKKIINDNLYINSTNPTILLYCFINTIIDDPLCPVCNEKTKFFTFDHGYQKYCSMKCRSRATIICDTTETCLSKFKQVHGNTYSYEESVYINNKTKIKIKCYKHGYFFQTPNDHKSGKGCPKCGRIKQTNKRKCSVDYQKNKFKEIHNNKYIYYWKTYKSNTTKMKMKCKKCGTIFFQTPKKHKLIKCCAFCAGTKGEQKIMKVLQENKVNYIFQHKFIDCKNKLPLPFDFFIPSYNICIEYDGEGHFEKFRYHNAENKFIETKINDNIKTKYCESNNIKLIRIPYFKYDYIDNILKEELLNGRLN